MSGLYRFSDYSGFVMDRLHLIMLSQVQKIRRKVFKRFRLPGASWLSQNLPPCCQLAEKVKMWI